MKDLGLITYFLELKLIVPTSNQGIMFTQTKYSKESIDLAQVMNFKPADAPKEVKC